MTTNFIGCFLFVVALISVDPGEASKPVADTPPVGVVGTRRDSESHARLIQVPLPITGNVERRLISQIRKAVKELKKVPETKVGRPLLVLQLGSRDPMPSSGSEFEDCLKLARYLVSPDLNGIKTVAYVPQTLRGHALLVLMACDQVLMAPDSVLGGEAKSRSPPDPTIVSSYRQIAASRKTFPETIARGFVDPNQKLLRVQTENGPFLVFANELSEFTKTHTIDPGETETIFPGGEPASLTAREARNLGIVSSLAESSAELASDLGLSRNDLIRDRVPSSWTSPQIILLDRYIGPRFAETRISMIDQAIRQDGSNFICLWMDSPQGDPAEVMQLAGYIAELDPKEVHTVAYIPTEARGSLPLIALACDDIVMHPSATLGGNIEEISPEDRADLLATVTNLIVPRRSRSEAIAGAFFDSQQVVFAFRKLQNGAIRYLTEQEWAQLPMRNEWQQISQITRNGESLEVNGQQAEDLGISRDLITNFAEFKTLYGLQDDPRFAEPNWVDGLVRALSSPSLAWLLILIGLAGIYSELQIPGIGIGGFVATVAFTIYFWANFMNHTADELEIVLFVIGIACLILEIFIIPGFGIFGLGGGALILVALILASQTFVFPQTDGDLRQLRNSLMTVGGALGGLAVFALLSRRFLPHAPLFSRLILENQSAQEIAPFEDEGDHLIGKTGETVTDLRPSGKAIFENELVDVIAEGEWIAAETPVTVVESHGARVVVKVASS